MPVSQTAPSLVKGGGGENKSEEPQVTTIPGLEGQHISGW